MLFRSEIREAIRHYLTTQANMVCEIGEDSIEAFLSVLNDDTAPDVILMDIGLPGISGISGIKLIKERYPEIDIIMFSPSMKIRTKFSSRFAPELLPIC